MLPLSCEPIHGCAAGTGPVAAVGPWEVWEPNFETWFPGNGPFFLGLGPFLGSKIKF